ncbi:MAG: DEAD/DEAH box helicase family protein [Eubacteriales bacterium]|nr:DEAD/DEAH box helicase family protein [Eubacteriales bacterium]
MKFRFVTQPYQQEAVSNICKVFKGQPYLDMVRYTRDLGIKKKNDGSTQTTLFDAFEQNDDGFENAKILLEETDILDNIRTIQQDCNYKVSDELVKGLGKCSLDVEMETGTGKTYVYINTIFELNERYGWSKFIVVVPSIAIREGVKKSFQMMEEHFMDKYHKKARHFIYNSKRLSELDSFASSSDINVMIINAQAFNARGADARRIDMVLDEFQSRRPIDVVAKTRPILIIDEPQKLGGEATQTSLKKFNPLFCMNFSATHKKQHNLVYCLDAVDAYNKCLVKKIQVKGFEVKNLRGTDKYLYLQDIVLSTNKPPMCKLEFEIKYDKSTNREPRILGVGDNLYHKSNEMEQYKNGYTISEINPFTNTVTFLNGEVLHIGEVVGDVSDKDLRRIQIRETILSHMEKEERLFERKIKCLSLFFIDEVVKYRDYSEPDEQGEYAKMFEQEYTKILNEKLTLFETPYLKYLKSIQPKDTHKGYFSVDKKSGKFIDSKDNKETGSDDISAYDLILKNKERLLSFEEPTRFIFSHSALREGWDNPNVFQICALKHGGDSPIAKRQEVGRGLRIAVNFMGDRVDYKYCKNERSAFHNVNTLTVIATDSYKDFVSDIQKEIKSNLADRPTKATLEYFKGKFITDGKDRIEVTTDMASDIRSYLKLYNYITPDGTLTDTYRTDVANNALQPIPEGFGLTQYTESIHKLIQGIFDEKALGDMFEDANQSKVESNPLNDNFYKKEFQKLWNYINHKYTYKVSFDSEELIRKSIASINDKLFVAELKYVVTIGEQRKMMDENQVKRGDSFGTTKTRTETIRSNTTDGTKYDLVGKIVDNTTLTRKTIVKILQGITADKFEMFSINPEEFISKVSKLINEQKANMIVDHITYNQTDGTYDNDIFTASQSKVDFSKAFKAQKAIQDYVVTDGVVEKSIERTFAEDLDNAEEVCVYAKLPRSFQIPTPVGNYAPDWAIAFNDGYGIKHIYFVAETKGTMDSLELRPIEQAKIKCAKKLFNELSTSKVRYHDVASYEDLLNVMKSIN